MYAAEPRKPSSRGLPSAWLGRARAQMPAMRVLPAHRRRAWAAPAFRVGRPAAALAASAPLRRSRRSPGM